MKISIFTPTYNRADTLERLYRSIVNENHNSLEWIIVDDGSTDNTKELIRQFEDENKIIINYIYQKNSGKHVAINTGLKNATGEVFMIVDSDDYLCNGALNTINKYFIKLNSKEFAGIGGLKKYTDGNIIGKTFKKKEYIDATSLERAKYNIVGDKAEVFFTDILRKYPFPVIEGEKFLSEAYVWNKIANDGYKIRWINDPLIYCEYRDDGITKNSSKIVENSPKGQLLYLFDLIKYEKNIIRKVAHISTYCLLASKYYNENDIQKKLKINKIEYSFYIMIAKIRSKI